jgi:O-antigen biosynthesis protein
MSDPRACFVVTELLGTVRNGGIATATTHAALVLAQHGYDVELLYCGHEREMEPHWADRYARAGVSLRWLDRSRFVHPPFVADSYRAYEQLRDGGFDTIVFQDWQGLGYCSMVAKWTGQAFDRTRLVHICHGPDAWLREANRRLAHDGHELASGHLERRSAELADVVVGPSAHLIDWMAEAGWQLPADRHVIPYFTEGHTVDLAASPAAAAESTPLEELVFFGRLEERKGVRIFAEALNALGPEALAGLAVAYLGREATVSRQAATEMIAPAVRDALRSVTFLGSFDQAEARAYLRQPGRLAIIPSYLDNSPNVVYECIEDRVSFLASRAGGTGELVAEVDREATLFDPTAASLAEALRPLVANRRKPPPPMPSYDGRRSLEAWRPILAPIDAAPPDSLDGADAPLVSVVVPHHDQPELVWETLRSVAAQDHPNLEIVLVDDGSATVAAHEALLTIEQHDFGVPVRVVRQENLYLGAARNTGVANAQGDLVAFVDDDDLVSPMYVSSMVRALVRTGADVVTMAIHGVAAGGDGTMAEDAADALWVFLGDAPHLDTMFNTVGGAAALYRRSALAELGGFFTHKGIGHEDWDMLIRCSLAGKRVVSIPEAHYTYRIRPQSMLRTTSTWANMQPVFRSFEEHLPPPLRPWAALTRGQQDLIDDLRARVAGLDGELHDLRAVVDDQDRYLAILRRALPPGARAGIGAVIDT